MGYLICNKCKSYYKLQPGESAADFIDDCDCGGKLHYAENIDIIDPNLKQAPISDICPKCGAKNPDGATFCAECGSNMKPETNKRAAVKPPGENKKSNKNNKKSAISGKILIGGIGIFVLLLLFALMMGGGSTSHFNSNGVAFDYPSKYILVNNTHSDPSIPNEVITTGTNNQSGFNFIISKTPYNGQLTGATLNWEKILAGDGDKISTEDVVIDGVNGKIITSTLSNGEPHKKVAIFIKNGAIYALIFSGKGINDMQSDINTIIKSFKVT